MMVKNLDLNEEDKLISNITRNLSNKQFLNTMTDSSKQINKQ